MKKITFANIISKNSNNLEDIFFEFAKLYPAQLHNLDGYKLLLNDLLKLIKNRKVFANKDNMY